MRTGRPSHYDELAWLVGLLLLWVSIDTHAISPKHERLKIALGDNYGKHAMVIDGKPAGIQKSILDWFLKEKLGLNVDIVAMPWKRAQLQVVQEKQFDGYFTAYTEHRVNILGLKPSIKPFYTTHVKMHTWVGNPHLNTFRQLSSVEGLLALGEIKHVFLNGHGYHEEQFKQAKQVYRTESVDQIPLFLLEYKRADIFVEQSELFYPLAEEAGLIKEVVTLDNIVFKHLDWHLYLRPDSEHIGLMSNINQALEEAFSSGELEAKVKDIFKRYGLSYSSQIK